MPLLSTRGGLSSRGFGQLNGGTAITLQSFTFPAGSSTFTVPATTNLLVSAVGAGADGSPGGTAVGRIYSQVTLLRRSSTSFAGGASLTYQGLLEDLNYNVSLANQGGSVYLASRVIEVGPNNLCDFPVNTTILRSNVIPNTATAFTGAAGSIPPSSGPVTFASVPTSNFAYGVELDQQTSFGPSTGASTTGFGLTFPGGSGVPSTTTTFNNIAVIPNQTYVIQNNKSLTITYFA